MTHLPRLLLAATCLVFGVTAFAADTAYLAKVNGVAIPTSALEQALAEARASGQADTPALRTVLTQRLIADELFWQEAKKLNLQNSPEAAAAAAQARRQQAIGQFIQRSVKPSTPSEAELRQRYERTVANLGPKEYRISLIQTTDEAALRDSAQRLAGGADFAAEARRISKVPSAQHGGALNWLSFPVPLVAGHTNGLPITIAQAIQALKPGAISPPIAVDNNWALVRLEAERPTQIPDYASTKPLLIQAAQMQAAAVEGRDLALRLIKDAKIESSEGRPAVTAQPGAQQ